MGVGWYSRTLRAALFAAICVLLAAVGHTMMSGSPVPWWALVAGGLGTGAGGLGLAGRERGLPLIVTVVVTAQWLLHSAFSLAQSAVRPPASGTGRAGSMDTGSMETGSMDMGFMGGHSMPAPSVDVSHGGHMGAGSTDWMGHMLMGGTSSLGMHMAHLLAAVLCGLWLACGERAAFRLLRAVAGWLAAPLRLLLALPAPPPRPRVLVRRSRSCPAPRRLLLVHAITTRGPPTCVAVV